MTNEKATNYAAGVLVIGDSGVKVDLGFVPIRSLFLREWEQLEQHNALSQLIVVDENSDRAARNSLKKINEGVENVRLLWNAERSQPYSYAMISLAREMPFRSFGITGSTACLEIALSESALCDRGTTPEDMRSLLIEEFRKPTNLSVGELKLLMKDQEDLIRDFESLAVKHTELELENQVLRRRIEQVPLLHEKLRELQSNNLRLRKRNDAFARKTFNQLTKKSDALAGKNRATKQGSAAKED